MNVFPEKIHNRDFLIWAGYHPRDLKPALNENVGSGKLLLC